MSDWLTGIKLEAGVKKYPLKMALTQVFFLLGRNTYLHDLNTKTF
jgi:hypothetical protein